MSYTSITPWTTVDHYQTCRGRECVITLEPRPAYCDRGNFLAQLFPHGALALSIDYQDGWPRYYFDEGHAKAEIDAWLIKRGQLPPPSDERAVDVERALTSQLYAWMGEDELGSGQFGIKQGLVPAGMIPLVATQRKKVDQRYIEQALALQSQQSDKRIYLVHFAALDIVKFAGEGDA